VAIGDERLEPVLEAGELNDISGAVLLGYAQSLQNQRRVLLARRALDRKRITTKATLGAWGMGSRCFPGEQPVPLRLRGRLYGSGC
jgi:hypothetical protein